MADPGISTALWYDTGAEQAATFYCSLFDDAGITSVFRRQDDPDGMAFVVEFTLMGQSFSALNGGPHFRLTPAVSISVQIDTQADVDRLWAAFLADGGSESRCGWLTDRFGLSWQIIPRALPQLLKSDPSGRVMAAMMGMVKIDIAALEAAARS